IFYLCGIPFLIIRHHYKDDKIVIEVCAFEDTENRNTAVATNEAESKAALIGHVSFSINFWTCMCSAPTLCHGPTFLVESNAIAAMWTFQESSPEAHCVQAGQESAPTF
ncbi:hypothetical protein T4D_7352, partial [Trichinella pseudospiralis]